ncbi:hypothetical protein LOC73_39935 [Mycolicibacterium mageritense]|nr:hypothetical protein [Mycolicibacterium mageritense]
MHLDGETRFAEHGAHGTDGARRAARGLGDNGVGDGAVPTGAVIGMSGQSLGHAQQH